MNLIPIYRAGRRGFRIPPWHGLLAALGLLAFVSVSTGQVTVETIGGGVRKECGLSYGFVGGSTFMSSQFKLPSSTALDSAGNLWVADTGNSEIEWITQAGNRASSLTEEVYVSASYHKFPNVIGVAVDAVDGLYVLATTNLSKFTSVTASLPNLNPQFALSLAKTVVSAKAAALAVGTGTNPIIYVSFTNTTGGTILSFPQPYMGTFGTVVTNYPFSPVSMAVRVDGQLAVCDALNSAIYVIATTNGSTPVKVAGGNGAGYLDGGPTVAEFNKPHGIAASADGRMVVCDTGNNRVRVIDTANNTTTLYGSPSNVWSTTCCSCSPARYAGWVDGTAGSSATNASSRQPTSITISPTGNMFVTESYYDLIREVTGSGLTAVITSTSGSGGSGSSSNAPTVTTQGATQVTANGGVLNAVVIPNGSPALVYFEWGITTTNNLTNTLSVIVATNLSSTNTVSIPLNNLPVNALIQFQAIAVDTNTGVTSYGGYRAFVTSSSSSISNQLGFASSHSVGIGATAYLPLSLELQSGTQVSSLLFRVEVTPTTNGGAGLAPPIQSLSLLPVTTNDFIPMTGPAPNGAPVNFTITPEQYPNTAATNGQGLLIFASPTSGLNIINFGVLGLLTFQIPPNALPGQTYSLNVLYPSAYGAASNIISLNQTLTVASVPYLAGDSSDAVGYEAGEFGDGFLDDNDVINAMYASMGIFVPPFNSDVYNAMDVFPPPVGDGLIQFQDWNTILLQAVGLQTPNWQRFWTNNGILMGLPLTNSEGLTPDQFIAGSKRATKGPPAPGMVWMRQASIGAGTATNVVPGNFCNLPVYVDVHNGYSLSGFQFRAIVTANGSAPAIGEAQFIPAAGIPAPVSLPGLAPNDVLEAWALNSFDPPLTGSNLIGTISFQIPPTAKAGQSYAVHFTGVDGAPNTDSAYAMESFPGFAWILASAKNPSVTSDEWKMQFFGSTTNSLADDNADADGDGVPNWQEFLAGTDPTNPGSALRLGGAAYHANGAHGMKFTWMTAPGKTYILQSIPALGGKSWTAINTNTGDGYTYQFIQNNNQGSAQFFRILLKP